MNISWTSEGRRAERQRLANRNRRFVVGYKEFMGCQRCSESRSACLQFHHKKQLNRRTSGLTEAQWKRREISSLVVQGKGLKVIVTEIEKCELLCANCHCVEHVSTLPQ